MEKNNVLLLGNSLSYILTSIQSQLKITEIDSVIMELSIAKMEKANFKSYNAILIYVDEELVKLNQELVYLKDMALEADIPVFAVGYDEELDELVKIIPGHILYKTFVRPVKINELTLNIKEYFDNHKEQEKKILVVDDSGAALRMVKDMLSDKYQVILANSGLMAIKYLAMENPDLILLDYEMPICDGKQVLEMIRAEMQYSDIPVIFLTAKSDVDSIINVMSLSPAGYLLKSLSSEEIRKYIDDFFEKQKAGEKNV